MSTTLSNLVTLSRAEKIRRRRNDLSWQISHFHWTRLMNDCESWWLGTCEDSDQLRTEHPEGIILGTLSARRFVPSHSACGTEPILFGSADTFESLLADQFPSGFSYMKSKPSVGRHPWTLAMAPCDRDEEE